MRVSILYSVLLGLAACGQGGNASDTRPDTSLSERFYSGCARPGEFRSAAELPAIPPSFDEDVR
ncbi:hypothetical protein I0D00_06700 [Pseudomonas lalucatii]|uniref:Lipoprotein n=1 Tax=Pseudomonas lalucatii TaxID=1424203 RepID=A0ABS5Q0G9_9PSED|nr:hypothetical protein [Pseudomonas lalucatii]MBS7661634.1 hypothetical protein [Pseudomonas lalucatii]MBS7691938.1 hypothetical protein [Pseudomonas lalucatii]MBS7723948.1 hypothetical protein [Pseudomonas lalucatii]QVM88049.1 hypothetical protein I0D68_03805 [Pseudomonas lalucatii]